MNPCARSGINRIVVDIDVPAVRWVYAQYGSAELQQILLRYLEWWGKVLVRELNLIVDDGVIQAEIYCPLDDMMSVSNALTAHNELNAFVAGYTHCKEDTRCAGK